MTIVVSVLAGSLMRSTFLVELRCADATLEGFDDRMQDDRGEGGARGGANGGGGAKGGLIVDRE